MKKANLTFIFTIILLAFMSCTNSSQKETSSLCDCIEAGEVASRISASLFDRVPKQEAKDSLDKALADRDRICFPFQHMLAHELQEKAIEAECESLQISTDQ